MQLFFNTLTIKKMELPDNKPCCMQNLHAFMSQTYSRSSTVGSVVLYPNILESIHRHKFSSTDRMKHKRY